MLVHRRVTPQQYVTGTCTYAPRPVVQKLRSALHRINHSPADNVIDFRNTYPLDSDLSSAEHYPFFEQPGPGLRERMYSKVSCLMKRRDGTGLNPGPPDPEFEVLTTRPHAPPL